MQVLRVLAHDLKKKIQQTKQNLFKMRALSKMEPSSKNNFETATSTTHQTQQKTITKKK